MHAVLCAGCDYFKHIPQVTMLKVITWLREAKEADLRDDAQLSEFFEKKLKPYYVAEDAIATIKAANLLTVVNQFRYACCCWSFFIGH